MHQNVPVCITFFQNCLILESPPPYHNLYALTVLDLPIYK